MSDNQPPSVAEIAALTARLRVVSGAGRTDVGRAEWARFLADTQDLIGRITTDARHADRSPSQRGRPAAQLASTVEAALTEIARARAEHGQYVLVGPSARTWRTDPATGRPVELASEAEHRAVRELLGRDELATEPAYRDGPDGADVVSAVIGVADEPDTDERDYWAYNHGWAEAIGEGCADRLIGERGLTGGEGPIIDSGPALAAEEAAHELAADGIALDDARALVRGYLDEVSAQLGAPVHQWGLDQADLTAIRAHASDPAPQQAAAWHTHQPALDRAVTASAAARSTPADIHEADPWAEDPCADYRTYTPAQAADQLIARGIPPARARGMVQHYLGALTAAGGEPATLWGVDDDDLATMLDPPPPGPPQAAGQRAPAPGGPREEDEHRAQLVTWRSADATAHTLAQDADHGADAGWPR